MNDAILYKLPNGQIIAHDPNSVFLVLSDGGKVRFMKDGVTSVVFRVKDSLTTYQLNGNNEVIGAIADIDLEKVDE